MNRIFFGWRLKRRRPARAQKALVASGGFIVPASYSYNEFQLFRQVMQITPIRRVDWAEPSERWARAREVELRQTRRMWDWP